MPTMCRYICSINYCIEIDYVPMCILLQPSGSVPFYQEVHNFMKEYSSDASKLCTYS